MPRRSNRIRTGCRWGILFLFAFLPALSLFADGKVVVLGKDNIRETAAGQYNWQEVIASWRAVWVDVPQGEEVTGLTVSGNHLLLYEAAGDEVKTWLLDRNGKVLCRLGASNEVGKYLPEPRNVVVDERSRQAHLFYGVMDRVCRTYDFEGNFVKEAPCKGTLSLFGGAVPFGENFLAWQEMTNRNAVACFTMSRELSAGDTLKRYGIRFPMGFMSPESPFAVDRDGAWLSFPLNDTVYRYAEGVMRPALVREHPAFSVGAQEPDCDYMARSRQLGREGKRLSHGLFCGDSWLWMAYPEGCLLYRKGRQEACFVDMSKPVCAEMIFPYPVLGQAGNELVIALTEDEVADLRKLLRQEGVQPGKRLSALFDRAVPGKLLILFYELK